MATITHLRLVTESDSADHSARITWKVTPDSTAPVISDVMVTEIDQDLVRISWTVIPGPVADAPPPILTS